jgi:ribosome maturation factor RimP
MNKLSEITEIVESLIEGSDCFLVSAKCLPGNHYRFYIDADSSFDLKRCVAVNRQLRNVIDERGWYPEGEYSLEVSSPGIEEPLESTRQFRKNINRLLKVEFVDKETKDVIGRITDVSEQELNLNIEDKKKKTSTPIQVERSLIKKATVQIEF